MSNGDGEFEEDLEEESSHNEFEEKKPVFLEDKEPDGKENRAKYWLMKGLDDEEVAAKGINPGTVRIARSHLIRDGYLPKERKPPTRKTQTSTAVTRATGTGKSIQTFAKGSPPEAIIESLSIPGIVDGQGESFESGMKFGMSTLVLAMRMVQELSSVGINNVKPLIDLTKSVREGEGAAFKSGADEAAMKTANAVGQSLYPAISSLEEAASKLSSNNQGNPMQAMMVRTMEPLIQNLMGRLIPGIGGGQTSGSGWTRKQEE